MSLKLHYGLAVFLAASLFSFTVLGSFIAGVSAAEPSKLKIYVGPSKVPADNGVYEAVFVQLQDAKGNPARALRDLDVSLSSSNTYVGSVDPLVTIRQGETYASAKFYSTYTPGSTTITAAASGFATVQASLTTVGPVPYKIAVYALPPILPADGGVHEALIVQLQDSGGSPAKAPIGDVNITLSSSNMEVGNVDSAVSIRSGQTYALAKFYTTEIPGTTTVTAMASDYVTGTCTIKTQIVSTGAEKLKVYVAPSKLPAEGVVYEALAVQLQDSKGNIAKAEGDLSIALSSSETSIGSVNDLLMVRANSTYALAKFYSTYRAGTTKITAAAAGYVSSEATITTVGPIPSKLAVYCVPSSLPADGKVYRAVIVQLQDSGGNPARDPIGDVALSLFSSNTAVGEVEPSAVIPFGQTYTFVNFTSRVTSGSAEITATTPGYTSSKAKMTTVLIDQFTLHVTATANPETLTSGEKSTIRIYVTADNVSPAPGATVKLTSDKGGTFTGVTDEKNGYYMAVFTAPNVNTKTTCTITVNATKTGCAAGVATLKITVNPAFQTGSLRIYVKEADGKPIVEATVTSTSKPSGAPSLNSMTNTEGFVHFTGVKTGTYTFEISKEGYETKTVQIEVKPDQTTTEEVYLQKSPLAWLNIYTITIIAAAACIAIGISIWLIRRRRQQPESTVTFSY
ncbi:MAG: carboxypeptidase regulatory-like domain-containing protein [Candidatus Bathyarchaeia archaeon]